MTRTIEIEGMSCSHCTDHVEKALRALDGVEDVVMSLEEKNALVVFGGEAVPDENLVKAVTEAGYTVAGLR